jgi:hypothetical protein
MKNVLHLFTVCRSWKAGRWFLSGSLLLLLFCLFTPDLILHHVISPQADFSRNGWWMHFYEPSHPVGVDGYETFIPGGEPLALNPDFKKARGYIIWDVPTEGQYCFKLVAKENAVLAIDGKTTARLRGNHLPIQRVDTWVSLTKGQHLFQVQLDNISGDGGFSVGMMIPPKMNRRLLQGADVAVPVLDSLDTWWLLLKILHSGKTIFWFFSIFFTLCLLLPITLKNRTLSVLLTIAIALAPALFLPIKIRREPYIGEMVHQALQEKRPDFVFIGNSMLWSRIDDAYLEHLLDGKKVYSIVNFAGLSAIHYLSFKYLFLPANITPKKVFIFFRSNQFILPRMRTTGPLIQKTVQRLTPAPDPVYEQIVHCRSRSITDTVYDTLLNIFPVAATQENIRGQLSEIALFMASTWQLDGEEISQKQQNILTQTNERFSFTNGSLRADLDTETKEKEETINNSYDFNGRVADSFLPHILQLAEDSGISLVFVRVQERPNKKGAIPDPPVLQTYMEDLQKYLTEHDAYLYDFSGDPELPLSAYHDGDHIKDQKKYTELFFRRVGVLLQ